LKFSIDLSSFETSIYFGINKIHDIDIELLYNSKYCLCTIVMVNLHLWNDLENKNNYIKIIKNNILHDKNKNIQKK